MSRILIITSCTGEKAVDSPIGLKLADFQKGNAHVQKKESELAELLRPAEGMYTGQQHVRLMRGVEAFREAEKGKLKSGQSKIDLWVLSAGYGLIPGNQKIAPYECTFQGMKTKELRDWADTLKVPEQFREIVAGKYDLGLILLGDSYLAACSLDEKVKYGGPTVLFCGSITAKKIQPQKCLRVIQLSNPDATKFSCPLIALKGEMASRVLSKWSKNEISKSSIEDSDYSLKDFLAQEGLGKKADVKPCINPPSSVDRVIGLSSEWRGLKHRNKLRYFIPEWDDQVDADYDFISDSHSGGSGEWSNQVYAHQMLPYPAYDGLLVSRIVAEKSKKKKQHINSVGVHRYLRVPRDYPVMGDCGAFGYINEKTPPYSTEDVLDYYTRLDFDMGVSVDHLIVAATEEDKNYRYELTIENAADFIQEHKKRGLEWTPIGAVQGWDESSYVRAAKKYVQMGYKYIALGGLVRTTTREIVQVMRGVRKSIPTEIQIHLFGVARLPAIPQLAEEGINSVDSASMLRKAWLGSDKNYLTEKGWYSAIRVPQSEGCYRAKRLVSEGAIDLATLKKLEKDCLDGLREFSNSRSPVSTKLIDKLVEYDVLVAGNRKGTEGRIRRTLEDRPWANCTCSICKGAGIEVCIFRGNNRNRRRGFHNTFIFYNLFQKAVQGHLIREFMAGTPESQPGLFDELGEEE